MIISYEIFPLENIMTMKRKQDSRELSSQGHKPVQKHAKVESLEGLFVAYALTNLEKILRSWKIFA